MKNYILTITWTPEDILSLRPDWTLEQCEQWMNANYKGLQDSMVESGWETIEATLDWTDGH